MLAEGSGLFRVDQALRSSREKEILAKHPWKARLESLLVQAREHGVDWVYFRLESGTGGPKPEAYIFDHTSSLSASGSPADIAKLHLELWNYGKVPLAFVLRPTAVDIFNLLQAPEFGPSGLIQPVPLETLDLSPADTLAMGGALAKGIASHDDSKWQRFSGARFDNGSFWEMSENRELGSNERGSLATMVKEMRLVRQKLEKDFAKHHHLNLKPEESNAFVHRLLILTLMVRFMEAREIIPPGYFADMELLGATDFKSLLPHRTPLLRALDRLAADFNGDIFTLSDQPGEVPMRSILSSLPEPEKALQPIADFANGKISGGQLHFWERYSFRHLPVEAISYVYEDFLGGKSQSYFTPHHLVDLLLDEAMPPQRVRAALERHDPREADSTAAFPVLDPSCGSGVFLVGAWQRLVEGLRQIDPNPSPEVLKRLMQQNIHGVDVERDSVELTIFSLCVALCSAFPQKADEPEYTFKKLKELKFPNLKSDDKQRRNVHCRDFFIERRALIQTPLRYQLIIGNPPFESKLSPDAQESFDSTPVDEAGKSWEPVPDRNISYLFLRAVPPLLEGGGIACLVQNASLLYNEKPAAFRKALFNNWHIPEILDFASISGLFKTRVPSKKGAADSEASVGVKTLAVMIEHRKPDPDHPVLHVTFRRTAALDEREVFEIDPQDLHWVPRNTASTDPRVWKADLLGGGRLLPTYNSLTSGETIESHIKKFKTTRHWVSSEGFIAANVESYGDQAVGAKTRYQPQHRPHYASLSTLETEGLSESGIDLALVQPCGLEWFLWPRDERLFQPPHLLIKEHESFPMVLRLDGEKLLFRDKVVGIAAPDTEEDRALLQQLYDFLRDNRRASQFFAAFGPQYLIFRVATPLKKNLMDLPYPKDGKLLFSGVQNYLRDDVIDFMIPLIKDTDKAQAGLAQDASDREVEEYIRVFLEVMRSAFPDLQSSGKPHDLGRAWCVAFHRGNGKGAEFGDTEALKKHLDGLLIKDMGRALRCWRIVRHFHGKNLYIVKPKPRRYWLKSAAVRDADEMFAWWSNQATKRKPQS
jgi:hypothetical protein